MPDNIHCDTSTQKSFSYYQGTLPIILNFAHSGRVYPISHLQLADYPKMALRYFEDPYLDLFLIDQKHVNTHILLNHYARAIIDVNRAPREKNDRPIINGEATGLIPQFFADGQPIYQNRLSKNEIKSRMIQYYQPYHQFLYQKILQLKQIYKNILIIDCHSMPSIGHKSDPDAFRARPDIIIGDNYGRSADPDIVHKIENILIEQGLSVFRNFPYAGGYITCHYGKPDLGIHCIQIEINRDLYIDPTTNSLNNQTFKIKEKILNTILYILKLGFF